MPETIPLDQVTAADFSPFLDTAFTLERGDGRTDEVTLAEARAVGGGLPGGRAPFTLTFSGTPGVVLPQRTYRLTHPQMGVLEIFLVPVGATPAATTYEAVFG